MALVQARGGRAAVAVVDAPGDDDGANGSKDAQDFWAALGGRPRAGPAAGPPGAEEAEARARAEVALVLLQEDGPPEGRAVPPSLPY
jgi:hypothetical protein